MSQCHSRCLKGRKEVRDLCKMSFWTFVLCLKTAAPTSQMSKSQSHVWRLKQILPNINRMKSNHFENINDIVVHAETISMSQWQGKANLNPQGGTNTRDCVNESMRNCCWNLKHERIKWLKVRKFQSRYMDGHAQCLIFSSYGRRIQETLRVIWKVRWHRLKMHCSSTKRLHTTVWTIQERVKTLGVLAFIFLCVVSSQVVLVIFKPFKHGVTLSNHSERSRRRISIFSRSLAWVQLALNCDISPGASDRHFEGPSVLIIGLDWSLTIVWRKWLNWYYGTT